MILVPSDHIAPVGAPSTWLYQRAFKACVWMPIGNAYNGSLELNSRLTAGGVVKIKDEDKELAKFLPGQLSDLWRIRWGNSKKYELWGKESDIERVRSLPVILAFHPPEDIAADLENYPPNSDNPKELEATVEIKVAHILPPPQIGEMAVVQTDKGSTCYALDALGAEGAALAERMNKAIITLANPSQWLLYDAFIAICLKNDGGYESMRSHLQSKLLSTRGREREQARTDLMDLEIAHEHANNLRELTQRALQDGEAWRQQYGEIQKMAETLAQMYLAAHKTAMASQHKSPQTADAFNTGFARLPMPLGVQATLSAISDAQSNDAIGWVNADDGSIVYEHKKKSGSAHVQMKPEDTTAVIDETLRKSLLATVREFNDVDGDVFLAMLAQSFIATPDEKGTNWIEGGRILDYRGIKPIMKRDGLVERRHGHRTEDLIGVARSIERISKLWLKVDQWIIDEKDPRGRKGKRKYTRESRLINIMEVIQQHELITEDGEIQGKNTYPVAWRYAIGTWIEPYLDGPNRQIGWMAQKALQYHPTKQTWEKRLSRYFLIYTRINASHGAQLLRRQVGDLIQENHLPLDTRNPMRTIDRFEAAMEQLKQDGHIDGWRYLEDKSKLPVRERLETWQSYSIDIDIAPLAMSRYSNLARAAQLRKERAIAFRANARSRKSPKN